MLTIAHGQYLDIQNPIDEQAYWQLVRTKSSPFFNSALLIGFIFGGGAGNLTQPIREFGNIYGEMIQIHDDLNDVMTILANPDWTLGRSPLPVLFASNVDHPDKEKFLRLRKEIPDPDALAKAQTILIRCGAISYCVHHLLVRYQSAQKILETIPLPQKEGLYSLLENIIKPIVDMYSSLGLQVPEFSGF